MKSKAKSMPIIFFDIKRITKNSALQAKRSILHTALSFFWQLVGTNYADKRLSHHDNALSPLPFSLGNFLPKTT
jgi:hypothetical protein